MSDGKRGQESEGRLGGPNRCLAPEALHYHYRMPRYYIASHSLQTPTALVTGMGDGYPTGPADMPPSFFRD